jgi:hypothetical protein
MQRICNSVDAGGYFNELIQDLGFAEKCIVGWSIDRTALSLTEPNPRTDHIISGAITGGAIATAAEFLSNLTY